ncbi:MAG: hypothetical protein F4W90_01830 [Gammaproteobacteria bacterium]|nr:hypothetical protein [Gammaproteobacteria bacterium]
MWRLTWRLLTFGIPLEFESQVGKEQLQQRMRERNIWHGLREKSNTTPVAFRIKRDTFSAFTVKVSYAILVRPVFYAELDATSGKIKGKFLFQQLVRIVFWLVVVLALAFEAIWLNRLIQQILDGLRWDQLFGFFAMLLPSFLALYVMFVTLVYFTRKNFEDLAALGDVLKALASE